MAIESSTVHIDGSYGEGGGALVRTALAMSAMTQQPLKLVDVRGNTRFPGLDPEDLTLIKALADSTNATTSELTPGASSITFIPTRAPQALSGRIATFRNENGRGPNALVVLSTLIPVLTHSGVYASLVVEGETYGHKTLGYDAFVNVTIEALKKAGLYAYPTLARAAYGREARGEVHLDLEPSGLNGLQWSHRGSLVSMGAAVATSKMPTNIASRAEHHLQNLAKSAGLPLEVERTNVDAGAQGCHITVWARYEKGFGSGSALAAQGIPVEALCQNAYQQTTEWIHSEASMDPFVADQLLLPLVFSPDSSSFTVSRLTPRLLTAIWVVKQFAPIRITVTGSENQFGAIAIRK